MERQSEVSNVSKRSGQEDLTDPLKLRDEFGRTFEDVVESDSKKYLKEVLILGAADFEHGAWEYHRNAENNSEDFAEMKKNISNASGENTAVDSFGDTLGAGSECMKLRYTHRFEIGDTEETKRCISGELLFGGDLDGAARLEDTLPEDQIESGLCLSPGEGDEKENVRRSWGARMMGVKKGGGSESNETTEKWDEGVQSEAKVKVVKDVKVEVELATSPPGMPDYIMANEAGGIGERNIRLVRAKRGVKGVCDSVQKGDGFSSVVELGINETRQRLIQKLTQDVELLETEIKENARRRNAGERKWLDYVHLKLKDLEVMRLKRLAEEEKCAEAAKNRQWLSDETTFRTGKVNLEQRKWNKYVEKELDHIVIKQPKDDVIVTEVQKKVDEEQVDEETGEMHSGTTGEDAHTSPPDVQTSGTHGQKTCPRLGISKENVKKKASGQDAQHPVSTGGDTRRLRIIGTPILQSTAHETDNEVRTPGVGRTTGLEKKRVTFSL